MSEPDGQRREHLITTVLARIDTQASVAMKTRIRLVVEQAGASAAEVDAALDKVLALVRMFVDEGLAARLAAELRQLGHAVT